MRPIYTVAMTNCPTPISLRAARCSSPLPSSQACPTVTKKTTKGITKEITKERQKNPPPRLPYSSSAEAMKEGVGRKRGCSSSLAPKWNTSLDHHLWVFLDVISKLVERTAAHLIGDHLERKRLLHEGQYGCRQRRSCVDAVAIVMNRTQQAWAAKKVAGALLMDVKSAFNNVSKAHLGRRMEALEVEPDLIRWAGSFMSDRQVKLVIDGRTGKANKVDTGIPQGSPAAPILFVTYLSGIFDKVEAAVPGIRGLSFVDDISWWAEGADDVAVAAKLSAAAAASIEWAAENGVAFDQGKTEAAFLQGGKRAAPTATVTVGSSDVPFNREATRWLGIWLDSQLSLKEHHAVRMKEGRKAMVRLRRLAGQKGLSPANCRKVMTACIQSVAIVTAAGRRQGSKVLG